MKSPLTTHALDTSSGKPAAGLKLELYRLSAALEDQPALIVTAICDSNGRVSGLLGDPSSHW